MHALQTHHIRPPRLLPELVDFLEVRKLGSSYLGHIMLYFGQFLLWKEFFPNSIANAKGKIRFWSTQFHRGCKAMMLETTGNRGLESWSPHVFFFVRSQYSLHSSI